jgi:chromosome condensin MukBEF complex kleisin-like MukF subunit
VEYDDQAWVAAANNIVAELARTNLLLERSILAAEGSRAAADRMCTGMETFLQQQREFQALLFGELRMGLRMTSDEVRKASDAEGDEEEKEEKDEEMNKGSGSEVDGSVEANESMEL